MILRLIYDRQSILYRQLVGDLTTAAKRSFVFIPSLTVNIIDRYCKMIMNVQLIIVSADKDRSVVSKNSSRPLNSYLMSKLCCTFSRLERLNVMEQEYIILLFI